MRKTKPAVVAVPSLFEHAFPSIAVLLDLIVLATERLPRVSHLLCNVNVKIIVDIPEVGEFDVGLRALSIFLKQYTAT